MSDPINRKCCICQLRPATHIVIRKVILNEKWACFDVELPICDKCQYRVEESK